MRVGDSPRASGKVIRRSPEYRMRRSRSASGLERLIPGYASFTGEWRDPNQAGLSRRAAMERPSISMRPAASTMPQASAAMAMA